MRQYPALFQKVQLYNDNYISKLQLEVHCGCNGRTICQFYYRPAENSFRRSYKHAVDRLIKLEPSEIQAKDLKHNERTAKELNAILDFMRRDQPVFTPYIHLLSAWSPSAIPLISCAQVCEGNYYFF